jgi:Fe-Mn family superoxide dismutase
LKTLSVAAATAMATPQLFGQGTSTNTVDLFTLPPLPYPYDALEPHIDARTMEIHHDRHHAGYVAKLNQALAPHRDQFAGKSVEVLLSDLNALPASVRTAVRNNGGGHANHSLFWKVMKPGGGGQPKGDLAKAIDKAFGSFTGFQDALTQAALTRFGSGWAWLALDGEQLRIESTPNQDSPLSAGRTPILGIDVWEHAYYLKYQNKRADYISAWFRVIDWDSVAEAYRKGIA